MRTWLILGILISGIAWPTTGRSSPQTTTSAPPATTSQPAITSRAALARYLKRTPRNTPPLGWLTPGARKRFLAQLDFTPRGVGGFSMGDLEAELTHPQIVRLLTLFGIGSYAQEIRGLTPAEQARRQQERRVAAKARGCASVSTCAESVIEQQYDKLVLQQPSRSLSGAQRGAWQAQHYDHLFARYQTASSLASASDPDLRLLKRAAENVLFDVPQAKYVRQLQRDLAAMQQRRMTGDDDFTALYQGLVASRQFDQARTLAVQHPGMDVAPLPTWQPPDRVAAGQPTALSIAPDGRTMTRKAFDLSTPLRIVIVASCHFSQDAARAIKANSQLRSLFAKHAIWLADQSDSIAAAKAWNQEFPRQPIHIAWRDSEWSMLDSWAMPTFYIFRHGKLVDQWSGWPAGSTAIATLRNHLRHDGVLPE